MTSLLKIYPSSLYIGYPGCEFQIREALAEAIGQEKSDFFFDKVCVISVQRHDGPMLSYQFLEYFFMDKDAEFFSSLGLNCIRLPFNYHHFEGKKN